MVDNIDSAAFNNMNAATADPTAGMFKQDDWETRNDWLEGLLEPKRDLEHTIQKFRKANPGVGSNIDDVDSWYKKTQGESVRDKVMSNLNWGTKNKYGVTPDELNRLFDLEKVRFGQSHYKEGEDISKQHKEYNALRDDILSRDYE